MWENGRDKEKQILKKIQERHKTLYCTEIKWSEEFKNANLNRLYQQDISVKNYKLEQVGEGSFLAIVVEDLNPKYGFSQSLDGTISISNLNIIKTKQLLRDILDANFIHSSCSISEFFLQAVLLFHLGLLKHIISLEQWDGKINVLEQDLAGAGGWGGLKECLTIASLCADYVVLRNFEYLPNNFWGNDSDIDILCNNLASFRSASGAEKRGYGIGSYTITVDGKSIPLDIRYLGDNYYDPIWQWDMLRRKRYHNEIIPRLSDDNYFFSLLYHCKLQKPKVKKKYISILLELAEMIGLKITETDIMDNEYSARIINGYLKGGGYKFMFPSDRGVYINKDVYRHITAIGYKPIALPRRMLGKCIRSLYSLIPRTLRRKIPKCTKIFFRRI